MDIDVGKVIAGKYELVRLIGKGAMGEVWLATHNSLGGEFAIKLVEPTDDMEAETAAGRFQLEAQIAAKLSRKTRHIVSVSDHGEEEGLAYLVMELLEGESLEARTKRVGTLTIAEVAAIVSQVARALSLAHEEGIFHRDLKPANVWLGKDEDGRLLVKLLDFGIARTKKPFRTRSPFATSKDMVLGTPSYMSPEQARGLETLDYRCDLWALAVVAYEALTKKIPFEGETVEDIFLSICTFRVVPALARRADLPPAIDGFFEKAFAPKLEARFGSATELTDALEAFVTPEEIEAAIGGVSPSQRLLARRSNPELAREAEAAASAARQNNPNLVSAPNAFPASDPFVARQRSSPQLDADDPERSDPMSIALGPTLPRNNNTRIIAIAVAISVVLLLILLLVSFRGGGKVNATQQPEAPSVSAPVATVTTPPPVPTPSATAPTIEIGDPKPTTTGKPPVVAPGRPKPPPSTPAAGTPVVTPPASPPPAPAASSAKPAVSARPKNPDDVF